jgi:hypothetical protein
MDPEMVNSGSILFYYSLRLTLGPTRYQYW